MTHTAVINPGAYTWDSLGVHSPHITDYDAETWVMLFAGYTGTRWSGIGYATAPKVDPHHWTRQPDLILGSGLVGAWDANIHSATGFYDPDFETWVILYGVNDGGIGLATGPTLESLSKYAGNPVFVGQGKGWEEYVRHPALIKVGRMYHLFYDGRQGTPTSGTGAIGHAVSRDLISWIRDGNNPIIDVTDQVWEATDVGSPDIKRVGNIYTLFYTGYDGLGSPYAHCIGFYTSRDLVTWVRYPDNPVITPRADNNHAWNGYAVTAPAIMEDNGVLTIYYTGGDDTPMDTHIGYKVVE